MQAFSIQLIPAGAQDQGFLQALHASTRADEVRLWAWDEAQTQAFLAQQFMAQQMGYRHQFGAEHDRIVHVDGTAVGRLFVAPVQGALQVVDIALLPAHRGRGIGTQLLRQVLQTAAGQGQSVRLAVLHGNPARHLYERLGFAVTSQDELYVDLTWGDATLATLEAKGARAKAPVSPASTGNCHATS